MYPIIAGFENVRKEENETRPDPVGNMDLWRQRGLLKPVNGRAQRPAPVTLKDLLLYSMLGLIQALHMDPANKSQGDGYFSRKTL